MPKAHLQQSAKSDNVEKAIEPVDVPRARQVHKEGEVNISAYFPADVKSSVYSSDGGNQFQ